MKGTSLLEKLLEWLPTRPEPPGKAEGKVLTKNWKD